MKIQILGSGCPKCRQLADNAAEAVKDLALGCEIEKVTDMNAIVDFGVMMTPALAIDGEVKFSGRVASSEEIKGLLQEDRA